MIDREGGESSPDHSEKPIEGKPIFDAELKIDAIRFVRLPIKEPTKVT